MKLSIIIPVYNVEMYIKRCLLSVLHQDIDYNEYEIIIINDGTKDNSIKIAQNLISNFPNVKIINQNNQGLSMARNNGLSAAKGDYVWFVDSDDSIEENCLSDICAKLDNNIDILQIQYRYTYDNMSNNHDANLCIIEKRISGKEQTLKGGVPIPAQFSIYRRKFLFEHNLRFFPRIYHEDSEFKPRVLYLAKSCLSYNKVVYNYYQRAEGSITSHFKLKNGIDIITVNNNLLEFVKQYNIKSPYKTEFYKHIGMNLNTLLCGLQQLQKKDKETVINELKKNKHLFHKMLLSKKAKYMIEACLFSINIDLGLILYKIIK